MGFFLPLPSLAGACCGSGVTPLPAVLALPPCPAASVRCAGFSITGTASGVTASPDKRAIRQQMQEAGPLWDAAWRQAASRAACEQLLGLPETQTGEGLSLFAPLADEVDIVPLILTLERRGRVLFFPRFNRELHAYEMVRVRDFRQETIAGHYQVREPRPDLSAVTRAELIDRGVTWLVPGVAFDRSGARLGRGRGYYDRLLTGTQGIKIGVGFSWRLSARPLPAHERDVRMDLVVTESEVVRVQPGTACS